MAEFMGNLVSFGLFVGVGALSIWVHNRVTDAREARHRERRRLEAERQAALFAGIEARWRRHLDASKRDLVA